MNENKDIFSERITMRELNDAYSEIVDVKKYFGEKEEVGFFEHLVFGHVVSENLLSLEKFRIYEDFILKYNNTVDSVFGESLKFQEIVSKGWYQFETLIYLENKTKLFLKNEFLRESKLEDTIYEDLIRWSYDWGIGRQERIGYGICDITIEYKNEKVAIELKKGKALRKDVYQAFEYSLKNSGYSPMLIASKISEDVLELANKLNVICYEYYLCTCDNETSPSYIYLNKVSDTGEMTEIENEIMEMQQASQAFPIEYTEKKTVDNNFSRFKDKTLNLMNKWNGDINKFIDNIARKRIGN